MSKSQLATAAQDSAQPQETTFDVNGLTLAAKVWGNPDGIPVLGLHGWLDNANTFNRLAPGLPELHLVALDQAGHGRSSHRAAGMHYESATDMQDILAVADQLGWETFALMGHSRGAGIASEFAGLFPERISHAVLIDGFVTSDNDVARNLDSRRQALLQMVNAGNKRPPVYPSTDDMIRRVTQATDQSWEAASELVARGHMTVPGGFTWRTDPRIRFRSPHSTSQAELELLMQRSSMPALLVQATKGDKWYWDDIPTYRTHHSQLEIAELDGPHHLHLEPDHCEAVLGLIRRFLNLD